MQKNIFATTLTFWRMVPW